MNATAGQVLSFSAKRGTLREYETVLILRPEVNKEGIKGLVSRIQSVLAGEKARVQKIENWGLRTLAFPVRHCKRGIYLYIRYLAGSSTVAELERVLKIREEIIRVLSVRVDEDVDPGARPGEVTADEIEAATESAPDPVELQAAAAAEAAANRANEASHDDDDDDDDHDDDDDEEDED
jgi:small subunit ribosomal protein S6